MATVSSPVNVMIGDLAFMAVPLGQATFQDKNAIYVVFDRESDGRMTVLDVGEISNEGDSPFHVPLRREGWQKQSKTGDIWVGTYQEPTEKLFSRAGNAAEDRAQTVARLRAEYLAT